MKSYIVYMRRWEPQDLRLEVSAKNKIEAKKLATARAKSFALCENDHCEINAIVIPKTRVQEIEETAKHERG